MKILIIGFGSIGKRHYKNLIDLGYKDIFVFDVNEGSFEGFENVKRIKDLKEGVLAGFKAVFICSPNNMHIKHALIYAGAGAHLFIEKPLSHNLNGLRELENICRKKRLITMIGCNMRFHPCLEFIKKCLDKKMLGRVYSIRHEFGYFLPYWRPTQDYRKNYAAKKSTGGGIILDDIHEFDLLFWLNNFNRVIEKKVIFNHSSDLDIQTEDQAIGTFLFKNKVLGMVICDYLQQHYTRKCKIVGERGALEWDFKDNNVLLKTKDEIKELLLVKNFDFNQVYVKEVKYFFDCVKKRKDTFNGIKTAASLLKYCIKK